MAPYRVLDSPYSLVSVKMMLAAGNVTRTMPCTSPAALMTVRSVSEAIRPSRQLSPQVSSLGPVARYRSLPAGPGAAILPHRTRRPSGMATARFCQPSRSPSSRARVTA